MANSNPVVSIIVPTYCEEKTIGDCLESIRKQKFDKGRIESLVVDSHSPDGTREVAKKSADIVLDLKGRGVGRARNVGARMAQGHILLFLDADTILKSNFVSEMYRAFADPRVVCVSGSLKKLERLNTVDTLFAFIHYEFLNMLAAITANAGFPLFPSVCCGCRKSVFEEVGGFVEDLAVAEDIAFSRKMGRVGKCVVNNRAIAYTSVRRISNCGKRAMYSMYFKNYVKIFVMNQKPWIQDFPHIRNL